MATSKDKQTKPASGKKTPKRQKKLLAGEEAVIPADVVITPKGGGFYGRNANRVYVVATKSVAGDRNFYFPRKAKKAWLDIIYDAIDNEVTVTVNLQATTEQNDGNTYNLTSVVKK